MLTVEPPGANSAVDAATAPTTGDPASVRDRAGAAAIASITCVVGYSWLRLIDLPFGDSHPGRVHARYALHVRNLYDHGPLGSQLSAAWEPYRSDPYAHHPPLLNIAHSVIGLLPGNGEYQVRIAPFVLALAAIPAGAVLLRSLGMSWTATLLSVGAFASTGFFWVYGQVMFDVGPILVLAACVVHLRAAPSPSRLAVVAAAVSAAIAMLASWPGLAFGVALLAWLALARRERWLVPVVAAGAAGALVSLAFMFGVHGATALADQTEFRTQGGSFTREQFSGQIMRFLRELLPTWYRWLLVPAIVAGLVDSRTRTLVAIAAVFAAGWIVVLNNGAYIHDYWSYLVVVPGLIGGAALVDRFIGWLDR